MCNIAAYVGSRPAAPILIDMLSRIEGMNAGFFTGIATIHEGRLHYRKLEGDLSHLLACTDAASLPGNIGIIHGRTPGMGGDPWAHPFIGIRNGTPVTALIANGSLGIFKKNTDRYSALAQELYDEGYTLSSKTDLPVPSGRTLSTGERVHTTDAFCQLVLRNMDRGACEEQALEAAFSELPVEMVTLMLSVGHPDRIFWSMLNKPCTRAVAPHGTYLASCAIAFPKDAGTPMSLPHCCVGFVDAKGFFAKSFDTPPAQVSPIDADVTARAFALCCDMLSREDCTLPELVKASRGCFSGGECDLAAPLVYEILYALHKQGRLHMETRRITHEKNRMDAPCFYMRLKD